MERIRHMTMKEEGTSEIYFSSSDTCDLGGRMYPRHIPKHMFVSKKPG
jgi:hypothetical protein